MVLAAVLAGLLFWLIFSDRFFSAYEAHPALLIPSLVVLGLVIASRPSMDAAMSIRMPTPWVRTFARPIFALFLAGFLYAVGSGWIAVISLWMARTPASVEFDVLEVRRNESRRSTCLRKVQLVGPSGWHSLCADALPVQGTLAAGRRVTALGKASPLGFHLEELRAP